MLKLGDPFATFESCSTASDVFFDDLNQRVSQFIYLNNYITKNI